MAPNTSKPMDDSGKKFKGKFIVFDGPDGCGKSTQLTRTAELLTGAGIEVVTTRDPGGTVIGDKIRQLLLDINHSKMTPACETMLYMASRAQLANQVIRPALSAQACVLCDRYISATIAYQGAGGIDTSHIRNVGEVAVGGLWPDLTIILDLPAEMGLARLPGTPDRMEAKALNFHEKVRELFLAQAAEAPDRFCVIDASGSVDQVNQRIITALENWDG